MFFVSSIQRTIIVFLELRHLSKKINEASEVFSAHERDTGLVVGPLLRLIEPMVDRRLCKCRQGIVARLLTPEPLPSREERPVGPRRPVS